MVSDFDFTLPYLPRTPASPASARLGLLQAAASLPHHSPAGAAALLELTHTAGTSL